MNIAERNVMSKEVEQEKSEKPEESKPAELSADHQNTIGVLSLYAVYEKLLSSNAITKEIFNAYLSKLSAFEQLILTTFLSKESDLVKAIQGKVAESSEENNEG